MANKNVNITKLINTLISPFTSNFFKNIKVNNHKNLIQPLPFASYIKENNLTALKHNQCLLFDIFHKQPYTIVFPKIKVRESSDSMTFFLMDQS